MDSAPFLPRVPKSPLSRNQRDDMSDGGVNEDPVSLGWSAPRNLESPAARKC